MPNLYHGGQLALASATEPLGHTCAIDGGGPVGGVLLETCGGVLLETCGGGIIPGKADV